MFMRKLKMTWLLMILSVLCSSSAAQNGQRTLLPIRSNEAHSDKWQAATYRGLTVGKSTRADVLRAFGRPLRKDVSVGQTDTDQDQEIWYIYKDIGELPGELAVALDKKNGKLISMYLYPEHLLKKDAIKHFGAGYIIKRYDFCPGFENADAAPTYESPNGEIQRIEYRERGIAIYYDSTDEVKDISYISKPIGLTSQSGCTKELQKYERELKQRKLN